jgi:hypothetical protein
MSRTGVQLITIADPFQTTFGYVVQSDEVVISRHSVDRADSNFMQPAEQVLRIAHVSDMQLQSSTMLGSSPRRHPWAP